MISSLSGKKQILVAAAAILAMVASATWIYLTEFARPAYNVQLHQSVGQVMAEETSHLLGRNAKVVVVSMQARQAPELEIQMDAFKKQLKLLGGISVEDTLLLDPGDNPKFRPGSGLSAKRFLKIVRKNPEVDAIISFVGAPQLSDDELSSLKTAPKFIAETHSPERLRKLFNQKVLQVAIVPRFEFPAPGPRKPETCQQWFDHYFQVITVNTSLPADEGTP
jgi:hypothetical protein